MLQLILFYTVHVILAFNMKLLLMWGYCCIFQMKWECNISLPFPPKVMTEEGTLQELYEMLFQSA